MIRALLSLMCLPMIPTPATADTAADRVMRPGPLVIAHRGFSRRAPENTLSAFRLALAARADLVELDYHHSADGMPMVIHDDTLDRTTDAKAVWGGEKILVRTKTAAAVARLDAGQWYGRAFKGEGFPTLARALEVIQAGGCTLIERKSGDATRLIELLTQREWIDQVVVQSFDWEFVRQAHRLAPDLVLGALGPPARWQGRELEDSEKTLSREFIEAIRRLGARVVVWNRQVTQETVGWAHQQGLRVWIYTINDPSEARELVALGVDGIITDDPARIRAGLEPLADEQGSAPASRTIPAPLPDHPGNVFLIGERVRVRLPTDLPGGIHEWRLLDDRHKMIRAGTLGSMESTAADGLDLGRLGVGWYRIEFGDAASRATSWTTAAVLHRLETPVPGDSPVAVDSATAWFARDDIEQQGRLANLAALAGVNWVRDRLRWRDVQPLAGPLEPGPTTYDTSAAVQRAAGLKVLQVFHDTPPWARETPEAGGRFAPDLRRVFDLGRALAQRFQGTVQAWEPWNEANVATFGGHTVDQMCSWQKAAWLGFKAGDPDVWVGWNVTAGVPTPEHTKGLLANETWPYFDTYNIHTYDWSHAYADLWSPAREATCGRPLWITEADRGTKHLGNSPWFDLDPRLERLKAEWIAQAYASSLFAGARRHFHFILGHYHEPNGVQFGLLRLDLTPRPAYVALAAVGRCLAGARILGRWQPRAHVNVYAFDAVPDGERRDVLVMWAEKEVDWEDRGQITVDWQWPPSLEVRGVVDYLGRSLGNSAPSALSSAPMFVFLPSGQAATLPLEPPPAMPRFRGGDSSGVVLQVSLPRSRVVRVEDVPWSEGYAYRVAAGEMLDLDVYAYNFGSEIAECRLEAGDRLAGCEVTLEETAVTLEPGCRRLIKAALHIPSGASVGEGWVILRGDCGAAGRPVLAFRVITR